MLSSKRAKRKKQQRAEQTGLRRPCSSRSSSSMWISAPVLERTGWSLLKDAADDSMSRAASDLEDRSCSTEDPSSLLPRESSGVCPSVDRELIRMLTKAIEELSLEWLSLKEPAQEWFLPGSPPSETCTIRFRS